MGRAAAAHAARRRSHWLLLFTVYCLLFTSAHARARPFELKRDTFAFSNDTAFAYGVDEAGVLHISKRKTPPQFAHGCFLLSRAVLQFQQFARFDAAAPKLSREEYGRRIRAIFRIPVWSRGPREKIVIPGYADLHSFSQAYEGLLKENLGSWMMTYLRVGNWRMSMPHSRAEQAKLARWLEESLHRQKLRAIYLSRFPHMNHVVIPYAEERMKDRTRFLVYDPNQPNKPAHIDYFPDRRTFEFPRQWYFEGGPINAFPVYLSPFH
jgi:hypothetical protein